MDGYDEHMSQPPELKCTRGCLIGSCFCAEQDEKELDRQDGEMHTQSTE